MADYSDGNYKYSVRLMFRHELDRELTIVTEPFTDEYQLAPNADYEIVGFYDEEPEQPCMDVTIYSAERVEFSTGRSNCLSIAVFRDGKVMGVMP